MAFNPQTAKPVSKFDPSTAKPINQVTTTAELPVDYDVTKSIENLPKSVMEVGGALAHAVMNPIDTAVAVGQLLGSGVTNTAQLGVDALGIDYDFPYQEKGEQFANMLDDRYGTLDRAKQTLMDDPAGALLDLTSVVAPVAGGIKSAATSVAKNATQGGKTAALATAVADGAEKTARIANLADPASLLLKAPMALGNKMLGQPISMRLYQSAMKPSQKLDIKDKRRILQTGLDNAALPTSGSVDRIQAKARDIFNQVENLENNTASGVLVPPNEVLRDIDKVYAKYPYGQTEAIKHRKQIESIVDGQLESIAMRGGKNMTIPEIGALKRQNYKNINQNRKNNATSLPHKDALMNISNAAKEIIEEAVPEVKPLNAEYGRLAELLEVQAAAAGRTGNYDIIPFGATMKSAALGSMSDVGDLATKVAPFLDLGRPKAMLAIAGDRVGKAVKSPKAPVRKAALGGRYEEAVLADEQEREAERLQRQLLRED